MAPGAPEPMEVVTTLPPLATSSSMARDAVEAELQKLGCRDDVIERVVAVVSELVANVVCHAHTDAEVSVTARDGMIRVEVSDSSVEPPVLRESDGDLLDDHGRGLVMVGALSDDWGVDPGDQGKTVWAEFRPGR